MKQMPHVSFLLLIFLSWPSYLFDPIFAFHPSLVPCFFMPSTKPQPHNNLLSTTGFNHVLLKKVVLLLIYNNFLPYQ